MGTISFVAPGFLRTLTLPAGGPRRTLLAIALARGIPILFTCEAGACGACVVRVETKAGTPPGLTADEILFLQASGRLGGGIERDPAAERVSFRLACQYLVGDEDIVVDFTNGLGSA